MTDFYIGLTTSAIIIALLEILKFFDKRLIAAFTLVGIPFIYIGFSLHDTPSLIYCIAGVTLFSMMAYFGYKKNFILVIAGLALHGVWDVLFPYFSSVQPKGYDIFCITIDIILAVYFFMRVKRAQKSA